MLLKYIGSTFSNSGFWYTLRNFWASNWNSGIYILALTALMIVWKKGKKKQVDILFYFYMIFLGIVLNPILFIKIVEKMEASTYQRFFWMIPYHLLFGAGILLVLDELKEKFKIVMIVFCACIGVWFVGDDTILQKHALPDNVYYCPNEVIEISNILHEESDEKQVVAMIIHSDYKAYMRQYDPSIIIPVEYNCMNDFQFTFDEVNQLVRDGECEFLVMPKEYGIEENFTDFQYEMITETNSCNIYKAIYEED